jgi:hypothetical protein
VAESEQINKDISDQLDKRMETMLDKVEASEDPKAIAAAFRTLVEFSRPKPPQVLEIGGVTANLTTIGEKDPAR